MHINSLVTDLYSQANRQGIARRILAKQTVGQGQLPLLKVKPGSLVRYGLPERSEAQVIRDPMFMPPEYPVVARHTISEEDLQKDLSAIKEVSVSLTTQTYVDEDKRILAMLGQSRNYDVVYNNQNVHGTILGLVSALPCLPVTLLIGYLVWSNLLTEPNCIERLHPPTKYELIASGELGNYEYEKGKFITLVTDVYRHPEHRVLETTQMILTSHPSKLGVYTDRGGYALTQHKPGEVVVSANMSMVLLDIHSFTHTRGLR